MELGVKADRRDKADDKKFFHETAVFYKLLDLDFPKAKYVIVVVQVFIVLKAYKIAVSEA